MATPPSSSSSDGSSAEESDEEAEGRPLATLPPPAATGGGNNLKLSELPARRGRGRIGGQQAAPPMQQVQSMSVAAVSVPLCMVLHLAYPIDSHT